MIQVYEVTEETIGLKLICRIKKQTLTIVSKCQTLWLKMYWDKKNELILEDCQIQIDKDTVTPEKIKDILNPCLILGFYSFPQASSLALPYSWSLISGEHQKSESWEFIAKNIPCATLPKLNLRIETLSDNEIVWESPAIQTSDKLSAIVYS